MLLPNAWQPPGAGAAEATTAGRDAHRTPIPPSSPTAAASPPGTDPEHDDVTGEPQDQAAHDGGHVRPRGVDGGAGQRSAERRADPDAGVEHPQQSAQARSAEALGDDGRTDRHESAVPDPE